MCSDAVVVGTIANGSGYKDWAQMHCVNGAAPFCANPSQGHTRTYFYPFGGLPITLGGCDYNLWGAVEADSSVDDPNGNTEWLNNDLATPHFNVCENSPGVLSYQPA